MACKKIVISLSISIRIACLWAAICFCVNAIASATEAPRHAVARGHPRLLGSRQRLQTLARQRQEAYKRVVAVARQQKADDHAKMISMALVCAIEQDTQLGSQAVQMAAKYINGPIRKGHTPFAHDLARCAIVYDLCHEYWSEQQRGKFHEYMNKTVDANVRSETHVFHNGWYGYKHWGIGLACYASYYENPRAKEILDALEEEWRSRAAPALELAGDGGGWAEGYYMYAAGDCTRAYSREKLEYFTRQIVFLRPGTFVIFDRVCSKQPQFEKTWLLQAMRKPSRAGADLVVTNGKGRLTIQTLLPTAAQFKLVEADKLYTYEGKTYKPNRDTGPAPQCRIEVSPPQAKVDHFLHVLTATDADAGRVERAQSRIDDGRITVHIGDTNVTFLTADFGGHISVRGTQNELARTVDRKP